MRLLTALLSLALLSCSNDEPKPMVWIQTHYELCRANATAGVPKDLVVAINRTNLPFGRYDGFGSGRPVIIHTDGSSEDVGSPIIDKYGQDAVSAASWSIDGSKLYINKRWEDPEWAMQEIFDGQLEFDTIHYTSDVYEYDLNSKLFTNLTGINRVSKSNGGLFPYAGKLAFGANVNGLNTLWSMEADGSNKQKLSEADGFSYGFNASPDGKHQAYHSNYQIYIDNIYISSPYPFNFGPVWSKDSSTIAFYCGNNETTADLCIYNGKIHKVASRKGFKGTIQYIEGYDFHDGGSDTIAWDDNNNVYFAAGTDIIEIYKTDVSGHVTQVTFNGGQSNFPTLSSDGRYLAYTMAKGFKRDLFVLDLQTSQNKQITDVNEHCTVRYPMWRH